MMLSFFRPLQRAFSLLILAATPLLWLSPASFASSVVDPTQLTPEQRVMANLMLDIRSNFYHSVQKDLDKGADINGLLPNGQLPILEAIAHHSDRVFDVLWTNPRLDINAVNHVGENLLMYLAIEKEGQYDKIKTLLQRGAKVNKGGWTPLVYAIYGHHPEVVSLLLNNGAAANQIDPHGYTPLTLALSQEVSLSDRQRLELVQALLHGGASARLTDGFGKQPIEYTEKGSDLYVLLHQAMQTSLH